MSSLAQRYGETLEKVANAAKRHGRNPSDITLIVVTKNHPDQLVLDLLDLGARDFGENRDQEASVKAEAVAAVRSEKFNWHFIGQLQTNKVKSMLRYANFLHSLDRDSLLDELTKRTVEREMPLPVFVQVNLTDDPGRGGVEPEALIPFAERVLSASGLKLEGLMGVAGLGVAPERDFERLAGLGQKLIGLEPSASGLSMGMSEDFEVAIGFGATHLRIGSAITGKRVG